MFRTDTLNITSAVLRMIAEIDRFNGAWTALGRLAPERLATLRQIATIESVASSTRIEGSQLTDSQVDDLLANVDVRSLTTRDEQEVAGYAAVIETILAAHDHMPVTENVIRQLHRDLLALCPKDQRHRGAYKSVPNSIEAFDAKGRSMGVIFRTASPFDTPRLMAELIDWLQREIARDELHPLLITAIFTVVFLEIHPFQDGNGRLSRVLTTLLLLRFGYAYVPYSSLESVIEQHKDQYYLALRRTQRTIRTDAPDWQPWLMFFLQSLLRQKDRLQRKIDHEQRVISQMPELSVQVLDVLKGRGRASLGELVQITGGNRNTLKKQLRKLVDDQQIVLHGAGRGAYYSLR